MKYNKIMLFFNIALLVSTVMRFFQIKYTVEFETGFFLKNFAGFGYFILVIIFLMALLSAVFGMTYYKRPENPPRKIKLLGVVAFFPAIAIILEVFGQSNSLAVIPLQTVMLKLFGLLSAAFFVLFGLSHFLDIKLPNLATVIPSVYLIIKIIIDFANISSLAIISDYIFLIAAYCIMLLFFINFAKLYNRVDTDYNFKKLLSSGLASSILCLSQSVTYFVINLVLDNSYNHVSVSANLSLLTLGLFITVFIFSHFSTEKAE